MQDMEKSDQVTKEVVLTDRPTASYELMQALLNDKSLMAPVRRSKHYYARVLRAMARQKNRVTKRKNAKRGSRAAR